MSYCNCEQQDGYANCCRNKSLEVLIDSRNIWITNLEAKLSAAEKEIDELKEELSLVKADRDLAWTSHRQWVDMTEESRTECNELRKKLASMMDLLGHPVCDCYINEKKHRPECEVARFKEALKAINGG